MKKYLLTTLFVFISFFSIHSYASAQSYAPGCENMTGWATCGYNNAIGGASISCGGAYGCVPNTWAPGCYSCYCATLTITANTLSSVGPGGGQCLPTYGGSSCTTQTSNNGKALFCDAGAPDGSGSPTTASVKPYILTISPSTRSIVRGDTTTYTVTAAPDPAGGMEGRTVHLALVPGECPLGSTCSFVGGYTSNYVNPADGLTYPGVPQIDLTFASSNAQPVSATFAITTTGSTFAPNTYSFHINSDIALAYGPSVAGTLTVSLASPTPPPPTNLVLSCPAPGTTASASWTAPSGGWNTYYFRANPNAYAWPPAVQQDSVVGTNTTFSTTPGQTYYVWVHTKNTSDGSWSTALDGTVTCTAAASPDLTAGSPTPTTALVNTSTTFSATISNPGSGSTGSSFNNFFEVKNAGGTTVFTSVNSLGALAGGASGTVTSSPYSFPSASTYSVRICADNNASFVGTISESNEGNNCGPWTDVVVSATAQPDLVITDFHLADAAGVTKTSFAIGENIYPVVTIRNNGTAAVSGFYNHIHAHAPSTLATGLSSDVGVWKYQTGSLAPGASATFFDWPATGNDSGSLRRFTRSTAGTYTARAFTDSLGWRAESNEINNQVTTSYTISAADTADIDVNVTTCTNSCTPTITWSGTGGGGCTITNVGTVVGTSGTVSGGTITTTTTYTINCGTATDSVTVTVNSTTEQITLIKTGQGGVTSSPAGINCGSGCSGQTASFTLGNDVTLTANPNLIPGRIFTGWRGVTCNEGSQRSLSCTFTMTGDVTVYANFAVDPNFKEF